MSPRLLQYKDYFLRILWDLDPTSLSRARGLAVRGLRLIYGVARDLGSGQLTLRAMSLVYTTLLSLVPLLALSFSVLKGFGVHNQMEPMLLHLLSPLGEKGQELTGQVIAFVGRMNVGVLGALGLGMLLFTVISLMQKIEEAFNFVWHVKRQRSFGQRFSGYLSAVLVGPLLMFSAVGVTASLMSSTLVQHVVAMQPLGTLVHWLVHLVPYLLVTGAFAFIYVFLPNTRVRVIPALVGGLTAGVLWETVGWGFGMLVVGSAKYEAIYSTFAILVMFMIWLFVSWLILLVGASVSFYVQHPASLTAEEAPTLSGRARETLALSVMVLLGQAHMGDGPRWTEDALADRLGLHLEGTHQILAALEAAGLVTADRSDPPRHLPARDLDTIRIVDVLGAVRNPAVVTHHRPEPEAAGAISAMETAAETCLSGRTVKDLINDGQP